MSSTLDLTGVYPSVLTEMTISKGVVHSLLSVANKHSLPSSEAELLFRLMAGTKVKMRLFSITNMMFYVSTTQLDIAVQQAKSTWERCYQSMLSDERISALYQRFSDEKLAMSICARHIEEPIEEIKLRLAPLRQLPSVISTQ